MNTEDKILADVLRSLLAEAYNHLDENFLCVDGTVALTAEQADVIQKLPSVTIII